jgi:hypothetical protein
MNISYNIQKAKELTDKVDYMRFECDRMQKISQYIANNACSLDIPEVDFLLSWLRHSNKTAEEIIAMLENAE